MLQKNMFKKIFTIYVIFFLSSPVLALSEYACTSWKLANDQASSDSFASGMLEQSKPFALIEDGDMLHLSNKNNDPVSIYRIGKHNEIYDIYERIDEYDSMEFFYFMHSSYDSNFKLDNDPKLVELYRSSFVPNWIIKTSCYKK